MKSRQFQGLIAVTALFVASFAIAGSGQHRPERALRTRIDRTVQGSYVPGEVLVKIKDGAKSRAAVDANSIVGATLLEELAQPDLQRVQLPVGLTVESAIAVYNTLDSVEYAQPNYYYHLLATPNDPQFVSPGMYGLSKIAAPAAWDLSTGSSSIVVANIDTGIRPTHQDLVSNLWVNTAEIQGNGVDDDANGYVDDIYGADFRDNDGNPSDPHGHGTHTAGTIGATGNNALNVTGVNWNVKIMSIKIYNSGGTDTTSAMLINAYNYVRSMKLRGVNIRATNNSYGGCAEACGYDQATKDAIDALGDAGIVNVFAAGNAGTNNDNIPHYPSNYTSPSIISVAASNQSDNNVYNYGLASVILGAPGFGILSTWRTSDTSTTALNGTSMATPHVTGAVALLAAYRPDLSPESLKASILNNVDPLANWTTLVKTGGRLNVFKALQNPTVCTFSTGGVNAIRLRGARAQNLTVNVTAPANCDYMAKSSAAWLTVTGNNVFSSNETITFSVSANNTGSPRTATISFGGRTFVVRQQAGGTRG